MMILTSLLRILLTKSLKPFIFTSEFEDSLSFESLDNLGLYVHIPFCRSLCNFCPYCKEHYNKDLAKNYKKALLREIDLVCRTSTQKKVVSSLYFGGGTPALMADDLHEIIQKLNTYFITTDGIGVELHPSDITPSTLKKLQFAGVTMVSIGIQSFNEDCLQKIGRTYDDFTQKLILLNEFGFEVLDVDLIFGIPGQDKKLIQKDISTAFDCGATQVSTYPFIDFTFANNCHNPLSHKKKKELLKSLNRISEELGTERTSVWTFAKKESQKYSSVTRDTFLGFGVSATTLLKNTFKINTFSIEGYIHRINEAKLPTSLTLYFTQRQRAVYYLFWSCYSLKINKKDFHNLIGLSLEKMYGFELYIAQKLGFLSSDTHYYYLTEKASYLYHYIEQQYTTSYIDKMWNISRTVMFPDKIILK
jgi:oxygen-independent coproporphyrinogen-3 oxidase